MYRSIPLFFLASILKCSYIIIGVRICENWNCYDRGKSCLYRREITVKVLRLNDLTYEVRTGAEEMFEGNRKIIS